MNRYYTAREAAEKLGVSLPTLYSYVSRGLIRSEAVGGSRRSRYYAEDVERLLQRKAQRRDPSIAVEQALHWGAPLLESSLTLIEDGRFYYRGTDALALAQARSVEEVAALLWTGSFTTTDLFPEDWPTVPSFLAALRTQVPELSPIDVYQTALALRGADDIAALDLRADAVAHTGARILRLLAGVTTQSTQNRGSIAGTLRRAWLPDDPDAERLIDAALILTADHELNVSSFTARCVASAGSTPYAVVLAGLCALRGVKHGGHTERVEALLEEVGSPEQSYTVLANRLRRGETIPGFGHRLYPEGDPRGRLLLDLTAAARPEAAAVELAAAVAQAAGEIIGERPTVDFGLATLARALPLPPGTALALFALGRTIGWIGHALEQYATDRLIRPRARYAGPQPGR